MKTFDRILAMIDAVDKVMKIFDRLALYSLAIAVFILLGQVNGIKKDTQVFIKAVGTGISGKVTSGVDSVVDGVGAARDAGAAVGGTAENVAGRARGLVDSFMNNPEKVDDNGQ